MVCFEKLPAQIYKFGRIVVDGQHRHRAWQAIFQFVVFFNRRGWAWAVYYGSLFYFLVLRFGFVRGGWFIDGRQFVGFGYSCALFFGVDLVRISQKRAQNFCRLEKM